MKSSNNILITGSSGFIGSVVLKELHKNKDNNFFLLKRKNSTMRRIEQLIHSKRIATFYYDELEYLFKNRTIDFVIHLATNYIKHDKLDDHKFLIKDNIEKPSKLLNLSVKNKVKGFINTGTFFEVDENENFITETSVTKPFNFYAKTKIEFQNILEVESKGINNVTLRLFSPYGPNDNPKVVPYIIESLLKDIEIDIDNPNINCDFTYVDDIAKAYVKCIEVMKNGLEMPKLINICSGTFYTLSEVIHYLEKETNRKIKVNYKNYKSIVLKESSNKLALDAINWMPETNIRDGLYKTYLYYLDKNKNKR